MTRARDLAAFVSNADGDIKFDTDTLFIDSSANRVGIGTDTPATKLSLVSNGAGGDIHVKNGSGQNALLELAGNNNTCGSSSALFGQVTDNTVNLFNRANANLVFGTNNTTRMTIDNSGNVGIGLSSSIDRKLHVEVDNDFAAKFGGTGGGDFAIEIGQDGNNGSPAFNATAGSMKFKMAGTEAMRILSGGGLTFNGDTSTDNALDDYEEGTWTPTLFSGSTQMTTTNPVGIYVKVGTHITVQGSLTRNDSTSLSGFLEIGGLPFARKTITYLVPVAPGWGWIDNGTGSDRTGSTYLNSTNNLRFVMDHRVDNSRYFLASDVNNSRPIYFAATYRTT